MAKILVVDDSALSRRILRKILEGSGHTVIEAEDGMAAIETYFLEKPDLVLLDLIMKGMSGMEVCQKLREVDKFARVIVASANIQTSTRSLTQEAGAIDFVTKPFNEKDLITAVQSALKEQ